MAISLMALFATSAASQTLTEFPLTNPASNPTALTPGPDGALWFIESASNEIGRITTAGAISEFPIPTGNSQVSQGGTQTVGGGGIIAGSDNAVWFTEFAANKIGRISTNGVVTEFAIPTPAAGPAAIAAGPDGALWFLESSANQLGRITTGGTFSEYPIPTSNSGLYAITTGADGALWFTESSADRIARAATDGSISDAPLPGGGAYGIASGADGALWIALGCTNGLQRITTGGVASVLSGYGPCLDLAADVHSYAVVSGSDGNLWYSAYLAFGEGGSIESVSPSGNYGAGGATIATATGTRWMTAGPDGAIWLTEWKSQPSVGGGAAVGRLSLPNSFTLTVAESGVGAVTSTPTGINCGATCSAKYTAGTSIALTATPASGYVFAGWNGGGCAGLFSCTLTLTTSTTVTANFVSNVISPNVQLVTAVLPSSRSALVGATVGAYLTALNAGSAPGSDCSISPAASVPATFSFQTSDPITNAPTGTPNTSVNIAAGGSQTFIINFTPISSFAPTDVGFNVSCANGSPAQIISGVNSLLLSGSIIAVPDIVAESLTVTRDGILSIAGASGSQAFVIATINLGAAAPISVSADTGSANLPLTLTICQTDPTSGQCVSAMGTTIATTIDANATPTFGIFGTASGSISFSPATSRIFVRFKDSTGVIRGATSVAVRTQ